MLNRRFGRSARTFAALCISCPRVWNRCPRRTTDAGAAQLIPQAKPIYRATGANHSPETGSPEMLMELVYRLAVFHDLHESAAYLYASTGRGPYNAWIDLILVSEWNRLAHAATP